MADKKTPQFDEFKGFMKKMHKAQDYSGEQGIKSPDNPGARDEARDFALDYALKNIIKGDKAKKKILATRATIGDGMYDTWLLTAIEAERLKGVNYFYDKLEDILEQGKDSKLEKLAKGFLDIPFASVKGNNLHNQVVALHEDRQKIGQILQLYEGKKIEDDALQKAATEYYLKDNPAPEGEERQSSKVRARLAQAFQKTLSLSPQVAKAYLADTLASREKKIKELLPTDAAKADYVTRNLKALRKVFDDKEKALNDEYKTADDDRKEDIDDERDEIFANRAAVADAYYLKIK